MALAKTQSIAAAADPDSFLFSSDEETDFVICKDPDKLKQLLNRIMPGKQVHYVSDGSWSMHDLVMELLKKYRPASLYFTTYALREFAVRQIILAQERGDIVSTNILLDARANVRTPDVYQLVSMNVNKVYLTSIHAKVTVIISPVGSISIVGSSNWTTNPKIECGVVSTNEKLAEFHFNWMTKKMQDAEIFS